MLAPIADDQEILLFANHQVNKTAGDKYIDQQSHINQWICRKYLKL